MENRITLITLGTSDLGAAIRFYGHGLKLPRKPHDSEDIAFFRLHAGQLLALFPIADLARDACLPEPSPDASFGGITLAHNVGSKDEVEAVLDEARRAGARILKAAQEPPWGGWSG